MTGYTVHTGSTEQFTGGWDRIFSGKNTGKKSAAGSASRKKTTTAAKKSTVKKKPGKRKNG